MVHNGIEYGLMQAYAEGFDILRNAGRATMRRVVREWGDDLARGGVGLFYYAGHGAQLAWRNYLIPVDAATRRIRWFNVSAM